MFQRHPIKAPIMQSQQSLQRKLPLLISTLLCAVVAAVCWSAYRQIEHVLIGATGSRLTSVTQQLATLLGESARRGDADMRRLATDPSITRFLSHPGEITRRDAEHALQLESERERNQTRTPQPISYALLNRNEKLLATVGAPFALDATLFTTRAPAGAAAAPLSLRVGAFIPSDSGVAYSVGLPVVAGQQDTIGFLVEHHRLTSGEGAAQIGALIGSKATLLLGNAQGGLWTDLSKTVAGPPPDVRIGSPTTYATPAGTQVISVTAPIPTTPWLVSVQVPRATAVAAAQVFLVKIAAIGLIFIVIGTLCAWLVSRWVTAPLAEITSAARDLARGEYTRRVTTTRQDELGSLALSFNSMATQVEASLQDLQVHAAELDAANEDLRASEERIGSSERHFRALIENASDMICILDREGRQLYVSPAQERFLGFAPAEIEGRIAFELIHPDDVSRTAEAFAGILQREGGTAAIHFRYAHKNGSWRQLSATATNLLHNPDVRGVVVNSHDVTENRLLQEQLLQSQKMEAVGQLAGGVAHDFNNLLTVVTSYSAMLLADLPEDDAARPDIREISEAAERAAALTRQLLAFSRRQVLEPRALDLNTVVSGLEKMLARLLPDNVRLATTLAPDLAEVYADPGQVEQVIVNLAVNARDAMPDGGSLTIQTTEAELDETYCRTHADVSPGAYVMLAVTDDGIGIDAQTQARIFEPFFTTKDVGKGTGLGLSTVYGITKQSGGHVAVYSEPGIGTTFKVYLPRAQASAKLHPHALHGGQILGGIESVLLVEDDAQVRATASRILRRYGYAVIEASSGPEALQLCTDQKPHVDVILTDMVMPSMSGRELASRIRNHYPNAAVAFMSGYTEDTLLRQGGAEPGTVFIHKPFTPHTLTDKLREALDAAAA
jgi:PAS domain S-box-containing protein